MGKIVGVVGLKGGVGKTSVVISLGFALAEQGKSVLLVDANFSAPNLGLHLNIIEPKVTLHHVLKRGANISDAIYHTDNLDVIPATMFHRMVINPLLLRSYLKYLKSNYDFILIDSSPALNDDTLATMLASDEILVVSTPDVPTMGTTLKIINSAKQRGINVSGMVLNKVYDKEFEISREQVEKFSDVPILAVIPHNLDMMKSLFNFIPFTKYSPNSEGSKEFHRLAATMSGEVYRESINLKTFMDHLFGADIPQQELNRDMYYSRVFG